MIERVTGMVTGPFRIAGRLAAGLVERVAGGRDEDRWEVRPQPEQQERRTEAGPDPEVDRTPKPLDDVAVIRTDTPPSQRRTRSKI
jgi:hypothetical protein